MRESQKAKLLYLRAKADPRRNPEDLQARWAAYCDALRVEVDATLEPKGGLVWVEKFRPFQHRFWEKVLKTDGCWNWTGARADRGYGKIVFEQRNYAAHRVVLWLAGIDTPSDKVVDHTCMNTSCVNPAHLRVVTQKINCLENNPGVAAKNAKKTHCPYGHKYDGVSVWRGKVHGRFCRTCAAENLARHRDRNRASVGAV